MDVESRRDLQLLEALEQEATITQRTLASRLGMALGLTNLYLKRLIRKGYVKCVTVSPNRLVYSLTPRGVARKARLTYEFMKYSLDFYRDARQHLRRSLSVAVARQKTRGDLRHRRCGRARVPPDSRHGSGTDGGVRA